MKLFINRVHAIKLSIDLFLINLKKKVMIGEKFKFRQVENNMKNYATISDKKKIEDEKPLEDRLEASSIYQQLSITAKKFPAKNKCVNVVFCLLFKKYPSVF